MGYKNIPNNRPLRLCFLGCGNICEKHTKTINSLNKSVIISFASRNKEKAESFKNKHNGHLAFASYNEAILSSEIDVVMITTPPDSHYELCKYALNNGKHVIVEKPPFYTSKEMEAMGMLAEEKGLQLMIAENYYYKPLRKVLENLLQQNIIGKPIFININATKKQKSKEDWRDDESISKYGAMYEGGIHWVNFINNIGLHLKNPKGYIPDKAIALERSMQLTTESDEGVTVNLLYSWEIDTMFHGLRISRIYGTEGSITFESNGLFVFARGRSKKFSIPKLSHITGFKPMFNDFIESLRFGKSPQLTWKMAKKDLEIIEQVYNGLK